MSRQLSVLLGLLVGLSAHAQMGAALREAQHQTPALVAVPAYRADMTSIYMTQVSMTASGMDDTDFRSFYVKPDLSWGIQYNYDLTFKLVASDKRHQIPDGYYQLTVASFLKDGSKINRPDRVPPGETLADRFVTRSAPTYIRITNGEGEAEIKLRFDNPTFAAIDGTLYIEFVPFQCDQCTINPDGTIDTRESAPTVQPGVYPYLFNMNFLPYNKVNTGKKSARLSEFSQEILKVGLNTFTTRALAKKLRVRKVRRPLSPERYASKQGLTLMDIDDAALEASGKRWLRGETVASVIRQALYSPVTGPIRSTALVKSLRNVFCQYVADQAIPPAGVLTPLDRSIRQQASLQTSLCQHGGEIQVNLRRVQHAGSITENYLQREAASILKYILMNTYSVGRSHEESAAKTFIFKPFKPFVKAIDPFLPFDYQQTVTVGDTRNSAQNGTAAAQEYMDLNPVILTIPTKNSRACLEVSISSPHASILFDARKGARQGFYVCDDVQPRMTLHEVYMHAFTRMSESSVGDPHDRLTQTANLSLRGDTNIAAFYYETRRALSPEGDDEKLPSWYSQAAEKYFADAPLPEPGLITSPIVPEPEKVPSYIDLLLSPAIKNKLPTPPHR